MAGELSRHGKIRTQKRGPKLSIARRFCPTKEFVKRSGLAPEIVLPFTGNNAAEGKGKLGLQI
jgi:hypothetical protein